jgi:uncharacterized peroxidase-related enzyme
MSMEPFVEVVDESVATGLAKEFYQRIRNGPDKQVPALVRAWSLAPEVAQAWLAQRTIAFQASGLSDRQYEMLLVRVTYNYRCAYVTRNHAWYFTQQGEYNADEVAQIAQNWRESPFLCDADRALLEFADKLSLHSDAIVREDYSPLRAAGFTEGQLVALAFLIGWFVTDAIVPNAFGLGDGDPWTESMQQVIDWGES